MIIFRCGCIYAVLSIIIGALSKHLLTEYLNQKDIETLEIAASYLFSVAVPILLISLFFAIVGYFFNSYREATYESEILVSFDESSSINIKIINEILNDTNNYVYVKDVLAGTSIKTSTLEGPSNKSNYLFGDNQLDKILSSNSTEISKKWLINKLYLELSNGRLVNEINEKYNIENNIVDSNIIFHYLEIHRNKNLKDFVQIKVVLTSNDKRKNPRESFR